MLHLLYAHMSNMFIVTLVEIDELKEKLEREQVERAAEAENHSDKAKAYQRTIREVQIQRDKTEARLAQLRNVSVTNKREVCLLVCVYIHRHTYIQYMTLVL